MTLTTTQSSALAELRYQGTLRVSPTAFDDGGRRTFSRRTLQALVDAGYGYWYEPAYRQAVRADRIVLKIQEPVGADENVPLVAAPTTTRFNTGYMDNAVFDLEAVLNDATRILTPVADEFDTLVGTGFSGGLVIPALALRLGKSFTLIRKEQDDSHHGQGRLLGELGQRWIFVDDFVSTGRTRNRVIEKIREATTCAARGFESRLVGNYYYGKIVEESRRYTRVEYDADGQEIW